MNLCDLVRQKVLPCEGTNRLETFVTKFIVEGRTFADLADYLATQYHIYYSTPYVYEALRPYCRTPVQGRKYYHTLLRETRRLGYPTVRAYVCAVSNVSVRALARQLGLKSPQLLKKALDQVRRGLVPVTTKKPNSSSAHRRNGFRSRAAYQRWLHRARQLGYRSLREAFVRLEHHEGLTTTQVASLFGVTQQGYITCKRRVGLIGLKNK